MVILMLNEAQPTIDQQALFTLLSLRSTYNDKYIQLEVYIKYKDPIITLWKLQKLFLHDFVTISARL